MGPTKTAAVEAPHPRPFPREGGRERQLSVQGGKRGVFFGPGPTFDVIQLNWKPR